MYHFNSVFSVNNIYTLDNIPYTGKGICTAILDTGIYPHKDLSDRIIHFEDFVNKRTAAYDDNSHGTHVAGIIAGNGNASKKSICGIAPDSNIISLKILDNKGNGKKDYLVSACEWIIENHNKYAIKIVNISIGSETKNCEEEKSEICEILTQIWDLGINIVVSAGNLGPGYGTITFPGTCENVITVGNDNQLIRNKKQTSRQTLINHSGEGPTKCNIDKPDLIAPGHEIISCHNKYNGYTVKSGTSMSTPIVSGAIALYLEKFPNATNDSIKYNLKTTATDLFLPRNIQGAGLLNIKQFLQKEPLD